MFICLEGIAGAGKTTQAKILATHLRATLGKKVFVSSAYEGKRRLATNRFMKLSGIAFDQRAIMFLFQALHTTQYAEVINALKKEKNIVADRWRYSFFAYHLLRNTSGIRDGKQLYALDRLAFRNLDPDITILLDIPPSIAHQRYLKRERGKINRVLEVASLKYLSSVRKYYLNIAKKNGWIIVDAANSKVVVARLIRQAIQVKE